MLFKNQIISFKTIFNIFPSLFFKEETKIDIYITQNRLHF